MTVRIEISENQAWSVYQTWLDKPYSSGDRYILLASNEEFGVEITMWASGNYPDIVVSIYGEEVHTEHVTSQRGMESTLRMVYDKYLYNTVDTVLNDDDDDRVSYQMDDIDDRELEIEDAIFDLLSVIAPDFYATFPNIDEAFSKLEELIFVFLYKECGTSAYRPMYLEDENGNEVFSEFPYEEIDEDDLVSISFPE